MHGFAGRELETPPAQRNLLVRRDPAPVTDEPMFPDFRAGNVRHLLADIGQAREELGYEPSHRAGGVRGSDRVGYVSPIRDERPEARRLGGTEL